MLAMTTMFLIFGMISSDVNISKTSKSQDLCPSDWVFLDSRCMYISSDSASWPVAVEQCEKMEAQLASVRDPKAVVAYVQKNYNETSFWLGASDTEEHNTWVWQSGEKIAENFPWGINPHNNTQPLGPRQHCMVLKHFKNGKGNIYVDNRCRNNWRYICEIPIKTKVAECSLDCKNGICSGPNSCLCDNGYTGLACDVPECDPKCEHGICFGPNNCQCDEGYIGLSCDAPLCTPSCEHGFCLSPDTCQCDEGYTGQGCDVVECTPSCEHGICLSPNTCQCDEGYSGLACNVLECSPSCLHGVCSDSNSCQCDEGYIGQACDLRCNHSVTADEDNWRYSWTSPGYDGVTNYADIDYECTLTITIPAKFDMYVLTTKFESPSRIFETRECEGDRVTYIHSKGSFKKLYCGILSGQSFAEVAVHDAPKTFHITWSSVKDGYSDLGWNMTMYGFVPKDMRRLDWMARVN